MGVGAVLVVIEYINSTLSIFLTKEVAEKEFPGPDGLHLHLASDLPTESYISFMMFRSSENGGHLYPIFIIFLEGNDFLSQINARKLVNWNNCIFFIEFFGVEAWLSIGELDEHGRKEKFYFFKVEYAGLDIQFDFDHAIEVHLVFPTNLNLLFTLFAALEFMDFPGDVQFIVLRVVVIV